MRKIFAMFGLTPAAPTRNPMLEAWCDDLKLQLQGLGYAIGHGLDYAMFHYAPATAVLPPRLADHFNKAGALERRGNPHLADLQRGLWTGSGGYAALDEKIIMLPDENELLERVAAAESLDPHKLKKAGITSQLLYAYTLIHEACHALRETHNEYEASRHGFDLFLQAGGLAAGDPPARFVKALFSLYAIRQPLRDARDDTTHGWTDLSLRHAAQAAHFRAIGADAGTMDAAAYGSKSASAAPERLFSLAHAALADAHRLEPQGNILQAAALTILKTRPDGINGPRDSERSARERDAALALLAYDESARELAGFAKPAAPVRRGGRDLLPVQGLSATPG